MIEIWLPLIGGLVLLIAGGELLVRGAVQVATGLGVSPLVIGLTLVGFGTSTPELVTSVHAALSDAPGIAYGNIVGSNIANILLIVGVAALISNGISQTRQIYQRGLAQNVVTDNPCRIPGEIQFTLAIDHLFQTGSQVFRLAVPDQIFSKDAGGVWQLLKSTGLDIIDGLSGIEVLEH